LTELGQEVIKSGRTQKYLCPTTGIEFEIKPTGWRDANGIHGYPAQSNTTFSMSTVPLAKAESAKQFNPKETEIP